MMGDRLDVLRHWLVFTDGGAPHVIRDEGRADQHRDAGYTVAGPFVLEAQQPKGAVSAESERWRRWASAHRCCDAGLRAAPDPCPWHDTPHGGQ